MRLKQQGIRYCAACFGQYPERQHVDFESMYDGPSIKEANGDYSPIADLVICENCLANAAKLLGYDKVDDLKQENVELGEALDTRTEENQGLREAYKALDESFDALVDSRIRTKKAAEHVEKPEPPASVLEAASILNGG